MPRKLLINGDILFPTYEELLLFSGWHHRYDVCRCVRKLPHFLLLLFVLKIQLKKKKMLKLSSLVSNKSCTGVFLLSLVDCEYVVKTIEKLQPSSSHNLNLCSFSSIKCFKATDRITTRGKVLNTIIDWSLPYINSHI